MADYSDELKWIFQELNGIKDHLSSIATDLSDPVSERRLVSLSNIKHPSYGPITLAACSDGSVWVNDGGAGDEWAERLPIPGTRRDRELSRKVEEEPSA